MNKIIPIFIFCLMFLGFISGIEEGVKIDKVLVENFNKLQNQEEDNIRVLIKLKNESKSSNSFFKIFNNKKETFEKINIDKNKINKEVEGYVSAYINKKDLEKLKTNNRFIESIDVEKIYHTLLQDSVNIMNFSSAWKLKKNALNLTGTSQTVCIIDTGVNYSHPDFGGCTSSEFTSGNCAKVIGGWDFCGNDGDCSIEDNDIMDVNGHGTHVSGIITANGGIKGTGPGTKIVMMKAANSSGVFFTVNIVAAIDRCVNNASFFNISVISMSLGGGLYAGYCDSDNLDNIAITNSINNAIANNISVVVATGNDGNSSYISSPACITNVTRVAATDKNDAIATVYSNRNSLVKLFATGSNINSTIISGGYSGNTWSGTSMATPMVAGAIAIINQYLSLTGQTKTPSQIEDTLYNTGLQFNESSNNFSRINVYNALLSLDVDAPNVTLVSPVNNKINITSNQTFTCNATDWQLSNITLKIWNSSGALYYNATNNLTGTANQTSFNKTNMSEETYEWNCLATDNQNNNASAPSNFTLTIGGISTTLLSPAINNHTKTNDTSFSCEVYSEANSALKNITFYLWNSSGNLTYNSTKNISEFYNSTITNFTFSDEGNYSWNCLSINNASNKSWGENNFSIVYDITKPNLTLTGSLPASETSNSVSKSFSFNVSDSNIKNCTLIINGTISQTNSSMNTSLEQTFTQTFPSGIYTWKINCTDFAENTNSSSENSFTITAVPAASSGGGSGGGGGGGISSSSINKSVVPQTYKATSTEISTGYTKKLKKDEKVNFSIFDFKGGRHLLTVNEVGTDYINLTIKSDPINLKLGIGQSTKLNLTSENYYDLFIKLNNITGDTAELTIQLINEPIEKKITETIVKEVVKTEVLKGKDYFWVIIVLIVILVSIVFVVIKSNSKKLKTRKTSKKDTLYTNGRTKRRKNKKTKNHGKNKKTKT